MFCLMFSRWPSRSWRELPPRQVGEVERTANQSSDIRDFGSMSSGLKHQRKIVVVSYFSGFLILYSKNVLRI